MPRRAKNVSVRFVREDDGGLAIDLVDERLRALCLRRLSHKGFGSKRGAALVSLDKKAAEDLLECLAFDPAGAKALELGGMCVRDMPASEFERAVGVPL